jgi:hypothetical protein
VSGALTGMTKTSCMSFPLLVLIFARVSPKAPTKMSAWEWKNTAQRPSPCKLFLPERHYAGYVHTDVAVQQSKVLQPHNTRGNG